MVVAPAHAAFISFDNATSSKIVTPLLSFDLADASSQPYGQQAYRRTSVCNHCPFAKRLFERTGKGTAGLARLSASWEHLFEMRMVKAPCLYCKTQPMSMDSSVPGDEARDIS